MIIICFADIATDPNNDAQRIRAHRISKPSEDSERHITFLSQWIGVHEVEPMLRHLQNISLLKLINYLHGFFERVPYELPINIVVCVYNVLFQNGSVPGNLLSVVLTLIPKVPEPKQLNDFRYVSVTPPIDNSRKQIVKHWVRSTIPDEAACDQIAF